jgi:hypothetical protein
MIPNIGVIFMKPMTMRKRLLAVLQGRDLDRVPLIMYEDLMPIQYKNIRVREQVRATFGDRIGLLRWSAVHKLETPHCHFETQEYYIGEAHWERITLFTPAGTLYQERALEPVYNSGAIRKHYVVKPQDYEILWAYLDDGVILEDYARYNRDQFELGESGLPLPAVERSPYQQLWIEWVGLDQLALHIQDYPERVEKTIGKLNERAKKIFEIAYNSPAPMIDFPDNITAPAIGLKRFIQYNVPLYNELANMLADRKALVFVHMDGDLKPLWGAIAESKVGGLDSFSPSPDNDTSVADAIRLWPDKRLFVNFPSSVHLRSYDEIRAEAESILEAGGHTRRLEIQFSENVPYDVWRTSFQAIADAVESFQP